MPFTKEELQQDIVLLRNGLSLGDQIAIFGLHEKIRLKYIGVYDEFQTFKHPYDWSGWERMTSSFDAKETYLQDTPPRYDIDKMKEAIASMAGILMVKKDAIDAELNNNETIKQNSFKEGFKKGEEKVVCFFAKHREKSFQIFKTILLIVSLLLLVVGIVLLAIQLFNIKDETLNKISVIGGLLSLPLGLIGAICSYLIKKVFDKDPQIFVKKINKKYQKYIDKYSE